MLHTSISQLVTVIATQKPGERTSRPVCSLSCMQKSSCTPNVVYSLRQKSPKAPPRKIIDFIGNCYGSRYFGGSVPHTGRGNRGTSRQPDSAHGQRILALRMCQGASFAGSRLLLDTFYAPVKSDHERHPAPMPDHGTMSLEFRRT